MLSLSIIIPVFNTRQFISDCLDSCLNQGIDHAEYEIIVVDDGSTDDSADIIQAYVKRYDNVHYFYQENQKQGAARNNGLKHAQGKYVWFVDADDRVVTQVLERILEFLSKEPSIEILRVKGERCLNGECTEEGNPHKENTRYTGLSLLEEDTYTVNIPYHLYSKDFLVREVGPIMERVYFEDNEFVVRSYIKCKVFHFLALTAYRVSLTDSSTTRTGNFGHFFDLVAVITSMISLYKEEEKELSKVAKDRLSTRIASCMNSALLGVKNAPQEDFSRLTHQLSSIKDLSAMVSQSGSKAHGLQYKLLKYPLILRGLMRLYY